jgi:hypothetical protein
MNVCSIDPSLRNESGNEKQLKRLIRVDVRG